MEHNAMSPIPTIRARFSIHYRKSNTYTAVAQSITLILRTTLQSLRCNTIGVAKPWAMKGEVIGMDIQGGNTISASV